MRDDDDSIGGGFRNGCRRLSAGLFARRKGVQPSDKWGIPWANSLNLPSMPVTATPSAMSLDEVAVQAVVVENDFDKFIHRRRDRSLSKRQGSSDDVHPLYEQWDKESEDEASEIENCSPAASIRKERRFEQDLLYWSVPNSLARYVPQRVYAEAIRPILHFVDFRFADHDQEEAYRREVCPHRHSSPQRWAEEKKGAMLTSIILLCHWVLSTALLKVYHASTYYVSLTGSC